MPGRTPGPRDLELEALSVIECVQPFRVATGEFVRCGSHDSSVCPSCASLFSKDVGAIFRSGVFDPPEGQEPAQTVMLTLTAPSFGSVHNVPTQKQTGALCGCGVVHSPNDKELRGIPLDLDSYDYAGCVRWNNGLGPLWNATRTKLSHLLGYPPAYCVVREWQRRGALHVHAILRFRSPVSPAQVLEVARSTTATVPWTGEVVRWGRLGDCQTLGLRGAGAEATARSLWYVSKALTYTLKSLDSGSAPVVATEHARRLGLAARRLTCAAKGCSGGYIGGPGSHLPCREGVHKRAGATQKMWHVSTGWSWSKLTRKRQAEARKQWAKEHADDPDADRRWRSSQRFRAAAVRWARESGRRPRSSGANRTMYRPRFPVDGETGEILRPDPPERPPPRPPRDRSPGREAQAVQWIMSAFHGTEVLY